MYYLAKLRFESEDDNGKQKKIREQYLVQASSVGEAEQKLMDRFGQGISPCQLEAVQESDALVIATEWAAFRNPDFDVLTSSMKSPVIFDGRNLYSIESMEKKNFYYESMGRKIVNNLRK